MFQWRGSVLVWRRSRPIIGRFCWGLGAVGPHAEDLMMREFRPALRNGVAVEVEVVIEVSFQIR